MNSIGNIPYVCVQEDFTTGGSVVKNLPALMQEMQVWSLGWKDPLEEETSTCSTILAWEIQWSEKSLGGHIPCGRKESDTT